MILSDNLFDEILVNPMYQGSNKLCIVSGYATAAMVFRHMQHAKEEKLDINVHLLVGMCPSDGISNSNHRGFNQLVGDDFRGSFECSYIFSQPAVHSKVYTWLRDDNPICSFAGSANYTQNAFSERQMEIMSPCDPISAYDYYQSLLEKSIYCTHNDVEGLISIYEEHRAKQQAATSDELPVHLTGLESARVSLITKQGVVPTRSGLNWGQRAGRNPNQAYLSLSADIYRTDFFPERKTHFTVLTDDGKSIICSRAQDNAKGIHTPHNNALLGEYFRNRIGLASGVPVVKRELENYGRTDVVFYKIDNETYYMDFSV